MKLYLPIKETTWGPITDQKSFNSLLRTNGQFFGTDQSGRACDFDPKLPCDKTLYEAMGWGPHKGLDIPVSTGTKIYASTDGKVTRISDDVTQGIGVVIWDKEQAIETIYWHLLSHNVKLSDMVKAGDLIGLADNTGYSTGPHLHFQVNLTNDQGKSGQAVDPINSFVWGDEMTKNEVSALQALEGYKDQAGIDYWVGKPLSAYLKARLEDKVKTIQAVDNDL